MNLIAWNEMVSLSSQLRHRLVGRPRPRVRYPSFGVRIESVEARVVCSASSLAVVNQQSSSAQPEIAISVNGTTLQDGQSAPVTFDARTQGAVSATVTFVIRNEGRANLTLQTPQLPSGFLLVSAPQQTVRPGRETTMVVALNTSRVGDFRGELVLGNNDRNEGPFNIPLAGTVVAPATAPEIAVIVDGREVPAGQSGRLSFGVVYTSELQSRVIRIRNTGNDVLTLSDIQVSGSFVVTTPRTLQIPAGSSRSIEVLVGGSLGTRTGRLTFNTNDSDERLVSVDLYSRVLSPPQTVPGNPIRVDISGIYTLRQRAGDTVTIDPPNGRVPSGTRYVVTTSSGRFCFDGTLHTLRIVAPGPVRIENFTGLGIQTQIGNA